MSVDAAVRTLEAVRRELSLHRESVDRARDLLADLPASELYARQADDVVFAVEWAVDIAPFLFGRSGAVERIVPGAAQTLVRAVGLLEKAGSAAREPTATLGAVGSILDDAARLLSTTDALIAEYIGVAVPAEPEDHNRDRET